MAATDGSISAYAIESAPGVLPATSPYKILPFQSAEPRAVRNFGDANEARDDFFDTEDDLVSRDAGFDYRRVFRGYANDDFFEMALFSRYVRMPYRENLYGGLGTEISDVDAGTSTFTLTAPGPPRLDFAPNFLVLATGFTNAANNGLFLATTGTNGTTLIITGATLVDETPPAGAKLTTVGIQLAAGDLAISGNNLVSTAAVDFAALLGVAKGYWCKIGSVAAGTRFAISAVNDAVRIGAIPAAGTLTTDLRPSGWADDVGATKTIRLFFAEPMLPANQKKTISWFLKTRRKADYKLKRLCGQFVQTLTIDGAARDYFNIAITFKGLDFDDNAADALSQAGGPIRETTLPPAMVAGLAGQRIYLDGVYSTKNAAVRSSSLVIEPTLVDIDTEGYYGLCDLDRSTQKIMLSGEAHFQDDTFYGPYAASTKLNFVRVMHAGTRAYVKDVKRMQFKDVRDQLPGRGQPVIVRFEGKATADDAGIAAGNHNNFFASHRFQYADGWNDLAVYA